MKEKKYCNYCGKENEQNKNRCKKCLKSLEPKDHLFIDYIKTKWFGDCKDGIGKAIKKFIQTHLYGFIMTCSIVVTATTIVVNITSSRVKFEVVAEKPTEVIVYKGFGLTGEEVVRKYVDAILHGDLKTVRSLQLETFYNDIREEIATQQQPIENPIIEHDLVENGIYYVTEATNYFKKEKYEILSIATILNPPIATNFKHGNYNYERYVFESAFCTKGDCRIDGGFWNGIRDIIEVIEVDGNFYINGEQEGPYQENMDYVFHRYVQRMQGDMSHYVHEPFYENLSIDCVESDACLEEYGLK